MKTAEDILQEKNRPAITVTPDKLVRDALDIMVTNKIGAILVEEKKQIVGIWTERDLMRNMTTRGFDPATAQIGHYMSTDLLTAPHDSGVYHLLDKFLGLRVRHLLIEKNGVVMGMLSTGDVVRANLVEKTRDLNKLNAFLSWEYYENWKWDKGQTTGDPRTRR